MTVMPAQKPGTSRQDFATPDDFIAAVKVKLGICEFDVDLAADASNAKAPLYLTEEDDALAGDWCWNGWCWLNPPFGNIEPFAAKCVESAPTTIAMLVPYSPGARWWIDYVEGKACAVPLKGRLSFDGVGPYPKDCALVLYGPFYHGIHPAWDWRKDVPK